MVRAALWFVGGAAVGAAFFPLACRMIGTDGEKFFAARTAFFLCVLLTGAGTAGAAFRWSGARCALAAGALWSAAFHSLTDLSCGYIYDRAVCVSLVAAAALRLIWQGSGALAPLAFGVLAGWLPIALVIVVTRGGMGWGDAGLMAGVGAFLGWKLALLSLYAGFMAGGSGALVLLLTGRVRRRDPLPLAPFLALGVFAALLWGWSVGQRFGLVIDF